ncbi:MAG: hypothetical protein NTY36_17490 [Deltaproteobacteria bacterium]|nr:hypothetical protein [Deltaproteobacteria bacterium]
MQKKIWLWALILAAIVTVGNIAWAQSDFYVIAGGGPPVGTKITSLPDAGLTISSPGFYFLAGNLNYKGTGNAITIGADDVTLDLMGFTMIGPGGNSGVNGIYMNGHNNVEVRNGTVRGFSTGVLEDSISGTGSKDRSINVRAYHNNSGIILLDNNNLIRDCSASNNNNTGLYVGSGLIVDSEANNNGLAGIALDGPGSVLGNTACNNGSYNFYLGTGVATSILADRNSAYGLSPNYFIYLKTSGVVITANNSGTP